MHSRKTIRYSSAFKRKVVSEVESGAYSISQAQKIYDIRGAETIQQWMRRLGKEHLLPTMIRVEMKDERDRLRALEQEKKELESALAQAHLKIITLESTLAVLEEKYGAVVKKKIDTASSSTRSGIDSSSPEGTR
jgi:transposase-like protein